MKIILKLPRKGLKKVIQICLIYKITIYDYDTD